MADLDKVKLMQMMVDEEGYEPSVYIDSVGVPTIGIGHNLHKPLSRHVIEMIYEEDMDEVLAGLDALLPWWRDMTPARQQVLASIAFNLGIPKLLKFKNTLAAMKAGDWPAAAAGLKNSKRGRQLPARTAREVKLLLEG
jgi:lysozyme